MMALGGGTDAGSGTLYAGGDMKQRQCSSSSSKLAEFETGSIGDIGFQIDDLLDFSNEDIAGPIGMQMQLCDDTGHSSLTQTVTSACSGERSRAHAPNVLDEDARKGSSSDDLCVPCDDLAELEWLSNFVHDEALTMCGGVFGVVNTGNGNGNGNGDGDGKLEASSSKEHFRSKSPNSVLESSASSGRKSSLYPELHVRGRPRTKRSRTGTGGRIWTSTILSSCSSADSYSHTSPSPVVSGDTDVFSWEEAEQQQEKDEEVEGEESLLSSPRKGAKKCLGRKGQDVMQPRRCMHCQTQRTPQWRTGPMGPKTLCNACGVRYKSGRLLPEYRPAGSPGYVNDKHSNSHKKILEMRRQKEMAIAQSQHHHPEGEWRVRV